jgi:hypothetical protein
VGAALIHADGRTDMTKLMGAFRDYTKAPKNMNISRTRRTQRLLNQRSPGVVCLRPHFLPWRNVPSLRVGWENTSSADRTQRRNEQQRTSIVVTPFRHAPWLLRYGRLLKSGRGLRPQGQRQLIRCTVGTLFYPATIACHFPSAHVSYKSHLIHWLVPTLHIAETVISL